MQKIILAFLLMVFAGDAYACSCASPGTPAQAFGEARSVFTARVTSADKNEQGYATTYTLTVNKIWKGEPGKTFVLGGRLNNCAYWNFIEGKDYLIYAHPSWDKKKADEMEITTCSRTKLLEEAQIETRYLDAAVANEATGAIDVTLPELMLGAKDPQMRAEAVRLVREMIMRRDVAVPDTIAKTLTEAAKDKSPLVRLAVTQTLGIFVMSSIT